MPTPTTPKSASLLANVKSTLEAITAGATYFLTPADVRHWEKFGEDITDASAFPVYIIVPSEERVQDPRGAAGTATIIDIPWEIAVVGIHHGAASRSEGWGMARNQEMRHDIIKAMIATGTRGGYAVSTQVKGVAHWVGEFQQYDASVAVTFEVRYRHQEQDPSAG